MPSVAERRKVLDGRAEVCSYTRNLEVFYLRVWRKETRSYWTSRIDGVSDIETACLKALEIYLEYSQNQPVVAVASSNRPKKAVATSVRRKRSQISSYIFEYLNSEQDRADAGLVKENTVKNKKETLVRHLIPYLDYKKLVDCSQIKVGVFDDYTVWRMNIAKSEMRDGLSRHTLRRELAEIKMFMSWLHRHKLLNPYEWTKDLIPSVKLKDEDWDSNPPIRDDEEWKVIIKHLHRYVKEGEKNPKKSVGINRTRFWTLVLLLRHSGLRVAEALALRWSDVEVENVGRISQSKRQAELQLYEEEGMLMELNQKQLDSLGKVDRYIVHIRVLASKTGALREVTCAAAQALARWKKFIRLHLDTYEKHFQYNGVVLNRSEVDGLPIIPDDVPIFSFPEKNEWIESDSTNYNYHWRTLIKMCGDELRGPILSPHHYTLYSLRSTKAQELMENGVDVYVAAKLMGHTPDILYRIYQRLPQRKRAIQEAVPYEYGKRPTKEKLVPLEEVT